MIQHDAHVKAFNHWFRFVPLPDLLIWISRTGYNPKNSGGAK